MNLFAGRLRDPVRALLGRERRFMTAWLAFRPRGSTDEGFAVIRCRPHAIEVWDAFRGITPAPFGLRSVRLVRTPGGWAAATEPVEAGR